MMMRNGFFAASVMVLAGCSATHQAAVSGASLELGAYSGADPWFVAARNEMQAREKLIADRRGAKNVILFVADGMDPTTVTAGRIFDGQSRGEDGEGNRLSFEEFPYIAVSKTYTTDFQVPDSAGTMTAMVTGVKTKSGVLSLDDNVITGDCASVARSMVPTVGELAKQAGMAVGVVSTTQLTHATPAAVYAHSPDRGWGSDAVMPSEAKEAGCKDIASQFIDFPYGDGIDIALAGGRSHFLPEDAKDPETNGAGARADGRNLAQEWADKSPQHRYIWNREGFDAAPANAKLLGLFEPSHMKYEADRADDKGGEPSLAEMTQKAIAHLSRNDEGFFLMVEAGRIDHAHHGGNALRALTDVQALNRAVSAAKAATGDDTLIIVTADHGHTMAIQGYPRRGNNILGLASLTGEDGADYPIQAGDDKPYTTLSYANGPGSVFAKSETDLDGRPALSASEVLEKNFRQQSLVPTGSETHGGQDVSIYATGPRAYLIGGVVEQNYIFHVIDAALSLRQRAGVSD